MIEEIQEEQVRSQQQCSICLAIIVKPVRCRGPCQKIFCLKCAAQTKLMDDRCPHRCSKPFLVEHVVLSPRLVCPYNPAECKIQIINANDLEHHYEQCQCISMEQRNMIEYKANYKCNKGHRLTFLPKASMEVLYGKVIWCSIPSECSSCGQSQVMRSMCLSCSIKQKRELYCSDCRPFPCTKTKCPTGHKLKYRNKPAKNRICDLCDAPAGLLGKGVHGFCACEFDICDICYQKLPEEHALVPLKCSPEKMWPFSMIQDDSEDSDWTE